MNEDKNIDSALEKWRQLKNKDTDCVVHISEAITNNGEYTTPYPLGYKIFDDEILGGVREGDLIVITGLSGQGKCFAKETKILMYDGTIKNVENIVVGDFVMGDDSTPRKVLSLGSGTDEMYDIIPNKGEKYTVNKDHILVLYNNNLFTKNGRKTINISVKDFLSQSNSFRNRHVGVRSLVNFKEKKLIVDPYFLGIWLGNGTNENTGITTADKEVVEFIYKYAEKLKMKVNIRSYFNKKLGRKNKSKCYAITRKKIFNPKKNIIIKNGKEYVYKSKSKNGFGDTISLKSLLIKLNVIENKHVPSVYKINSEENRLKLLAGLLDTDGYYFDNCYKIITKYEQLKEDILFLARSVGLAAYNRKKRGKIGDKDYGFYNKIIIFGNVEKIPCLVERKKPKKRMQLKDALHVGIKIVPIGYGEYFGFTLDGNGRFLLGDFTITHNTSYALNIAVNFSKQGLSSQIFSYEVLIDNLYAKLKLMDADVEKLKIYTPKNLKSGNVGWIYQKVIEGAEKFGTKFIFIDHLDFIAPQRQTDEQRRIIISDICTELKTLAKDLRVVIFLLAHVKKVQNNRAVEMQDLAEGSATYKISDLVFVVERETFVEEISGKKAEVIKNNNGTIRMLKNRISGTYPIMNFQMINNKIVPVEYKKEQESVSEINIEVIDEEDRKINLFGGKND